MRKRFDETKKMETRAYVVEAVASTHYLNGQAHVI